MIKYPDKKKKTTFAPSPLKKKKKNWKARKRGKTKPAIKEKRREGVRVMAHRQTLTCTRRAVGAETSETGNSKRQQK